MRNVAPRSRPWPFFRVFFGRVFFFFFLFNEFCVVCFVVVFFVFVGFFLFCFSLRSSGLASYCFCLFLCFFFLTGNIHVRVCSLFVFRYALGLVSSFHFIFLFSSFRG